MRKVALILEALHELQIDVPVERMEVDTKTGEVILHLQGGEVRTWMPTGEDAMANGLE